MFIYLSAAIILLLTLAAHLLGLSGVYFHYPWYDIFMHILGGVGIGLFLTAIVQSNFPNMNRKFMKIIVGVFLVGIVWELFEMYFDIAGAPLWTTAYYVDSVKDLVDDVVGGTAAVWLCIRGIRK